jgi:hypothetical protein
MRFVFLRHGRNSYSYGENSEDQRPKWRWTLGIGAHLARGHAGGGFPLLTISGMD